jgi:hypothetical protein
VKQKIAVIALTIIVVLLPFITKLPIPADTIPGLYHPMRDLNFGYSNGVPVKNPLITDPVRQQFAWKWLAVEQMKKGEWPLWNSYNFSGTPLAANFQTAAFYPLNIIFFIPNIFQIPEIEFFAIQWSWFIYLQMVLAIYFMFLYLKQIGLSKVASLFGGIVWAYCGFNIAWWEWGNVVHTALWFPLMLYAAEKIVTTPTVLVEKNKATRFSLLRTILTINKPGLILLFALTCSFLAGHLQTFIMAVINLIFYLTFKIPIFSITSKKIQYELTSRRLRYWVQIAKVFVFFILLTAIQWLTTFEFIQKSARNVDPTAWLRKDWFFPYEHFISFISPDFFGNPTTNNYWGVWNYGEFSGYIGTVPLLLALAIIVRFLFDKYKNRKSNSFSLQHHATSENTLDITEENSGVGFFIVALIINLILITRNPFTELVYGLNIPFLTTTQPSRGIAVVDFSLIVLAAVGFNETLKAFRKNNNSLIQYVETKSNINFAYIFLIIIFVSTWGIILTKNTFFLGVLSNTPEFDVFNIARSNLIFPTVTMFAAILLLRTAFKKQDSFGDENKNNNWIMKTVIVSVFCITIFDLGRFFLKFESFSDKKFLYPKVGLLEIIQKDKNARYMTEDSRILAPNMNIPYKLSTSEGYDPLYLDTFGQLTGLWQRNEPDLSPFPANRILTPHIPKSIIADISASQYLLSFGDYTKYEKIAQIGQTKLFKRDTALPRASILSSMRGFKNESDLVKYMFSPAFAPRSEGLFILKGATVDIPDNGYLMFLGAHNALATIKEYSDNQVTINANLIDGPGLLYLADTYEEGWKATIDNKPANIIKTNFAFRGLQLPQGEHVIKMTYSPESFTNGLYLTVIGLIGVCGSMLLNIYKKNG